MDSFSKMYQQLNKEQQQAVDAIEGPLLILAGPGTGKTQLLSARVANILTKTDTDPSTIVCLTFTVNAANNMRERLRGMIGSAANHVVIKTFHSLAADMIASHPDHFYAGATLNPVSDLAAQEILQSIFETLPHDSPLASKYDDRYIHLTNALDAISRVKDAGITPEKLHEFLADHLSQINAVEPQLVEIFSSTLSHKKLDDVGEAVLALTNNTQNPLAEAIHRLVTDAIAADMPTGKTTQLGKVKARLLSTEQGAKIMGRERRGNAWWQALETVYQQYQAILYKRGYLDYSDMLLSVIEALESDQDLQQDIQESIHYLLIDEFQDSNQAQIRLMHLLVDNPLITKPNVMVVGDPNQTIYGFNGAMLDNTTDFLAFYAKDLTAIDLTKNYRSSQQILDNSRGVIEPYTKFQPHLVAENPPKQTTVNYFAYNTQAEQAADVCTTVKRLQAAHPDQSIAILARGHASLSYIAQYLYHSGITLNYDHSVDIRSTVANKLLVSVLGCLDALAEGNRATLNHQLSHLVRHPVFALDAQDLWQIALQGNASKDWLDALTNHAATSPLAEWLNKLVGVATSQSLSVLIEQVLSSEFATDKTLYQAFYGGDNLEKAFTEAQATTQLLAIAGQYAQTDHVSIALFLRMIESADPKLFRFSPDTGQYKDAVTLMTVHGAKGLEFDHVLIVDTNEAHWKPKAAKYLTPLNLPIHVNLETPADYARLLYVAMTRAKQTLAVSYVKRADSKTQALPAEQLAAMTFQDAHPRPTKELLAVAISELLYPRPNAKTMLELLANKLSGYRLSATALTHFLDLSREGMDTFIEENLLKLPQPVSDVLAHGNAMHSALELAQIQVNNNKFNLDAIKRLYAQKIGQENLSTAVVKRLLARANSQLDALFGELGLKLMQTSISEQSLSTITSTGTALFGKIDRIDTLDNNTVRIVDYKTGKPIENSASKSQDVLLKQWRHKCQLGFYVLLLRQTKQYAGKTIQTQIVQLDATSPQTLCLDYELTAEELARIEQLAAAVYNRIVGLDIPDVSEFEPTLIGIKQFEDNLLARATQS